MIAKLWSEQIMAGKRRYVEVPAKLRDQVRALLAEAGAEEKEKGIKGLAMEVGMDIAAEMIAKIKDEKICSGVHVMAIGAEKNVPAILQKAGVSV